MTPIAQGLVKEDALALAEYFAAKPWPNTGAPAASKADTEVAMVADQVGRLHELPSGGVSRRFVRPAPRGPAHDYLAKTMTDFRNRTRANNPGMSDLMNTVTPEQLAAIAAYLAGL